jgi:hypothetical protein
VANLPVSATSGTKYLVPIPSVVSAIVRDRQSLIPLVWYSTSSSLNPIPRSYASLPLPKQHQPSPCSSLSSATSPYLCYLVYRPSLPLLSRRRRRARVRKPTTRCCRTLRRRFVSVSCILLLGPERRWDATLGRLSSISGSQGRKISTRHHDSI